MLTASTEEDAVIEAVAAGATSYLQKETDRERLLSMVRSVALGELRLPPDVVRRVFAEIRAGAGRVDPAEAAGLTPREREILVPFAQGKSHARISAEREIQPVTVRNAVYGIQRKLGGRGRCRDWCSGRCGTGCWTTMPGKVRRAAVGAGRLCAGGYGGRASGRSDGHPNAEAPAALAGASELPNSPAGTWPDGSHPASAYSASVNLITKVLDFVQLGGPCGNRTHDSWIKSPELYLAELTALVGDHWIVPSVRMLSRVSCPAQVSRTIPGNRRPGPLNPGWHTIMYPASLHSRCGNAPGLRCILLSRVLVWRFLSGTSPRIPAACESTSFFVAFWVSALIITVAIP